MIRNISKIFFAGVMLLSIASCKKRNLVADTDITPPSLSEIIVPRTAANNTVTYYIANSSTDWFSIPVGITTVANVDRTIQLTYTSTTGATQGVQYSAPTSVTIKAGQALDSLRIHGIFAGFPTAATVHEIVVKITGGDVPKNVNSDSVKIILRKYCDVVFANLAGNYSNTNEYTVGTTGALTFSWGPYITVLKNITSTGLTSATAKIENLYDDGWADITVKLDWSNPANFTATIDPQTTGKSYSGGVPTFVRTTTSTSAFKPNTFSSCERSITVSVDLYNSVTNAVLASNYRFVLQ
jgi:hypothetical protein